MTELPAPESYEYYLLEQFADGTWEPITRPCLTLEELEEPLRIWLASNPNAELRTVKLTQIKAVLVLHSERPK